MTRTGGSKDDHAALFVHPGATEHVLGHGPDADAVDAGGRAGVLLRRGILRRRPRGRRAVRLPESDGDLEKFPASPDLQVDASPGSPHREPVAEVRARYHGAAVQRHDDVAPADARLAGRSLLGERR